jgi:type I restriction enzyme S subunit
MVNGGKRLPEGWEWSTLGEIADLVGGGTPSRQNPEYFKGDIVWLTPTEIPKSKISVISDSREKITQDGLRYSSARLIPKGSVLMTSRASIGYVAIAGTEVTTNQGFASFVPKQGINNFYLAYWLWANGDFFIEQATGTTFKEITKSKLRNFSLPIPPLPEQERIVSRIEELFSDLEAGVAALERARAGLRRYKASVLKAACEGKLLERRGLESSGELPEEWRWATLESVALKRKHAISSGPFGSALGTKDYRESGIPVLRGQNIKGGKFNLDNLVYITEEKAQELIRSTAIPGDLVVVAVGSSGQPAIVPDNLPRAILSQNCNKITLDSEIALSKYVVIAMQTDFAQDQLSEKTTDTARPFLSLTNLKKTIIPLPPLDEQRRIVAEVERRLSVVGEVEAAVGAGLVRAGRLRQAVLRSAFEGRLA